MRKRIIKMIHITKTRIIRIILVMIMVEDNHLDKYVITI